MSVLATLKDGTVEHALAAALMRIEKKLDRLIAQTAPRPPADDESIGRDPSEKYWAGESYKGCRLSECPPHFLRAYAKYRAACAWAARKNDANDPKKMQYAARDEKTAKLASEWAEYREALGVELVQSEPQQETFPAQGEADDIPF